MRYISLFSGIEAATVAWESFGWEPVAFAEIDPFCSALLAHYYSGVPNLGNVTKVDWSKYRGAIDLIVGGPPCQSFSVSGRRGGLEDPCGILAIEYFRVVDAVRPVWFVLENVPGLLSSNFGGDLGLLLGIVEELGYHAAWRIFDAQYFGVPQRRRRIYFVGHSGDWRRAAQVLFEPESLRGYSAPSKSKKEDITQALTRCFGSGGLDDNKAQGGFCVTSPMTSNPCGTHESRESLLVAYGGNNMGPIDVSTAVNAAPTGRYDFESETFVINARQDPTVQKDSSLALDANQPVHAVAFCERTRNQGRTLETQEDLSYCLTNPASGGRSHCRQILDPQMRVRRLTPRECERLQGFPDNYTLIPYRGKPATDSPRYKALGNSMAVPVMRWIGGRIDVMHSV